jgi:hypothetical protein
MLKKIFIHLLEKYSRREKDRLEILESMWNSVLSDYNEQTHTGNLKNFQIEFIMSNPWIRYVARTYDSASTRNALSVIEVGSEEAIEFLKRENASITFDAAKSLIAFKSIKRP